jgi:nucleotide-binding universal stress UspA family protein
MTTVKGINSILFIADNAPDEGYALKRAVELAEAWRARLVVMDVLEVSALEGVVLRRIHHLVGLQEKLLQARKNELETMVAPYAASGLDIRVKVGTGRLHFEVVRAISRGGHKLLIKGAKGPAQEPRAIGPMDSRLIGLSPCPVMILREQPRGPILAAVALDTGYGEEGSVDSALLRLSDALARMNETSLHLAHAWELPDAKVLRAVSSADDTELLRVKIEEAHRALLEKMIECHPHIPVIPHLLEGWASHTIPRLVAELQVELLVIGSAQKGAGECPALGSILEVIIHQVGCSILVVKP